MSQLCRQKPPAPEESHAEIILQQYRAAAGVLEEIFRLCPDTSWHEDGIGSCKDDATVDDEITECGVPNWRDLRHARRQEANPDSWRPHTKTACFYHQPDKGCSLGDLKSPVCLGITDFSPGLPASFAQLGDVPLFLNQILQGHFYHENREDKPASPADNWPTVRAWIAKAELVLADCKAEYTARTGRISLETTEPK